MCARLCERLNRYDEAIKYYKEFAKQDPFYYKRIAGIYKKQGKTKEAAKFKEKYGQNCRVNVLYKDGKIINGVKFKKICDDFQNREIELIKKTAGNKVYKK